VRFKRFSWVVSFVVAAGAAGPVYAQSRAVRDPISYIIDQLNPFLPDFKTTEGYKFRLGAVAGVTPAFEGSNEYRFRYAPTLDITYRDRLFLNSTRFRINVLPSGDIRGGFQVQYRSGRKERVSSDLRGLGDVGAAWVVGGYVEARFGTTILSADITRDIASGQGWAANLLVGQGFYQDDNTTLGAGVETHWAGGKYMNAFFGISPAQSAASGLPTYHAGSGFKDVGLILYWSQDLTKHIVMENVVSLRRMVGSAGDSPLVVERGSPNQLLSSIGLRYQF